MQRSANAAGYASVTGCIGANGLPYCAHECGRLQPKFQMQAHATQHAAKKCDARPDSLLDGRARTKSPKSMRYTGSRNATRLYEKNAQSIYQVF